MNIEEYRNIPKLLKVDKISGNIQVTRNNMLKIQKKSYQLHVHSGEDNYMRKKKKRGDEFI